MIPSRFILNVSLKWLQRSSYILIQNNAKLPGFSFHNLKNWWSLKQSECLFFQILLWSFFCIIQGTIFKILLATINDIRFPVYYIIKNLKWSSDKSLDFYISKRKEKAKNHYGTEDALYILGNNMTPLNVNNTV